MPGLEWSFLGLLDMTVHFSYHLWQQEDWIIFNLVPISLAGLEAPWGQVLFVLYP